MSQFFKFLLSDLSGRLVNIYQAFRKTLRLSDMYQPTDRPRFIFKDPKPRLVLPQHNGVDVSEDGELFLHDGYSMPAAGERTREHVSVAEPIIQLDVKVGIPFRLTSNQKTYSCCNRRLHTLSQMEKYSTILLTSICQWTLQRLQLARTPTPLVIPWSRARRTLKLYDL